MITRRTLLASAAVSPLLAASHSTAWAQVQTPGEDVVATPITMPEDQVVADLSGATPLPLTGERLATFESYVTAKERGRRARSGGGRCPGRRGGFPAGLWRPRVRATEPVTADTLLRIGSVTKSFSLLLTATLVDAGRLSWDTPLVDLLPIFAVADPALSPRLTARDAFCACTGLPGATSSSSSMRTTSPGVADRGNGGTTAERAVRGEVPVQQSDGGTGGFAAAVADGGSPQDLSHAYAIALRERVLNPIGMPRTTLDLAVVLAGGKLWIPRTRRT